MESEDEAATTDTESEQEGSQDEVRVRDAYQTIREIRECPGPPIGQSVVRVVWTQS